MMPTVLISILLSVRRIMDEVPDDDQQLQISIRRPFQPKFIKELNVAQNEKNKRKLRKMKEQKNINPKKMEKFETIGIPPSFKSIRRLPETNRNGNKIFAHWKNNQIQGEAEIYYSNGVIFKGYYQNGIKVKGHFTFLHGYEYIGHCLGNKFNGEGSLIFPSGKIITGEWKEYNLVDKGKIQYPNGQVYYGEIRNLKKHGKGYLFFKDGSKYEGQFQDGQITGYGTYYVDNQAVSSGNWVDGELEEEINLQEIISEKEEDSSRTQVLSRKSMKLAEKSVEKVQKKLRFADLSKEKNEVLKLQEDVPTF